MTLRTRRQDSGGLHVLLIDNVASSYWVDRSMKVPPGQPPGDLPTLQAVHAAAVATLSQVSCLASGKHHTLQARARNTQLADSMEEARRRPGSLCCATALKR